ncbi:MAG: AAA family ATPase [Bacteroides sp.]|nr:AAA family ATPase [Bacteroides sp.]
MYNDLKLTISANRNKDGFFLRAESFYNVASEVERLFDPGDMVRNYGGSLHHRSHGESFLALFHHRFSGEGLYIFDEPESALSLQSQLQLLLEIKRLVELNSQFIIATHSPILLSYPDADIYYVSETGLQLTNYEDTEQYKLTKYFTNNYKEMIERLRIN